jgi:site-specific recombinase XerD
MRINTSKLSDLSLSVLQYLVENKYSEQTQEQYRCTYNQFKAYLVKNNIDLFRMQDGKTFIQRNYGIGKPNISRVHYANLLRRVSILFEFYEHNKVVTKRFVNYQKGLTSLQVAYEFFYDVQNQRNLRIKTLESKCAIIKKYLFFLEQRGIKTISEMTVKDVYAFISSKADCAVSTKEYILYTLRDALKIFAEH